MKTRSDFITDEHLIYLDELRDSGITNMFAAPNYIQEFFQESRKDALAIVGYWMSSFGNVSR
jgi:hypothetical protein